MLAVVDGSAECVEAWANDCVLVVVVVAVLFSTSGEDLGSALGSFGFPGVNFDTTSEVLGKGNDADDMKCKITIHLLVTVSCGYPISEGENEIKLTATANRM